MTDSPDNKSTKTLPAVDPELLSIWEGPVLSESDLNAQQEVEPPREEAEAGLDSQHTQDVRIAPAKALTPEQLDKAKELAEKEFIVRMARLDGESPFDVLGFTPAMIGHRPPLVYPELYQLSEMDMTRYNVPAYRTLVKRYNEAVLATSEAKEQLDAGAIAREQYDACVAKEHTAQDAKVEMLNRLYDANSLIMRHLPETWEHYQNTRMSFVTRMKNKFFSSVEKQAGDDNERGR